MDSPVCLGKFMDKPGRECDNCTYMLQCYELFRKYEKEQEKQRIKSNVPWFKRPVCKCEICG